jgi:hypothetical protein
MKPTKGYYCIVQYCPDLGRLEAANVGVLLFCPERYFLKARTVGSNRRIQQFFGRKGHDWEQIESFKIGIEERLEIENERIHTLEDLEEFIATRANLMQITPPRPMRVVDPQTELDQLFKDLVGGAHRKQRNVSFRQYVAHQFSEAGIEDRLQRDIRVEVPVLKRVVQVPFGFQNGFFNLVRPARFRGSNRISLEDTACRYAIEGESLFKAPKGELGQLQLVVVGEFGQSQMENKDVVKRILEGHRVRLFAENELGALIDEIRTSAKVKSNGER